MQMKDKEDTMSTAMNLLQIKGYDVWSVSPDTIVFDALRLMADKDIGALLVMENDRLVGILSERDYARKIVLFGKSSHDTKVREIMTEEVITIHPMQTAHECMALMTEKRVRHLPVMEGERVLGMISIGDVVRDIIYSQREAIKSLEDKVLGGGKAG